MNNNTGSLKRKHVNTFRNVLHGRTTSVQHVTQPRQIISLHQKRHVTWKDVPHGKTVNANPVTVINIIF